jgi:hypothetical protein
MAERHNNRGAEENPLWPPLTHYVLKTKSYISNRHPNTSMAELSKEKREKLDKIFKELEGKIKFDGTACDLLREVRKPNFDMAL